MLLLLLLKAGGGAVRPEKKALKQSPLLHARDEKGVLVLIILLINTTALCSLRTLSLCESEFFSGAEGE